MSEARSSRSDAPDTAAPARAAREGRLGVGPQPVAAPLPVPDIGGPLTARELLALQHLSGNRAVSRLLEQRPQSLATPLAGTFIQRNGTQVSVTGVNLNHSRLTVPPEASLSLKAGYSPPNATGVKFSVEKGSVEPSGASVDASGIISVTGGQPGGDIKVAAESDDGAKAWADLRIIEKPTAVSSTSGSAMGGAGYGASFRHTFSGPSGNPSGLKDGRVNEKFDATSVATPFGQFALQANPAGSAG